MKVLFLTSSLNYGGAERTISYLSEYLAHNGDEASILCLTDDVEYSISEDVKVICGGIPSHSDSLLNRVGNVFRRFTIIHRVCKEERPDVVFCMISSLARFFFLRRKHSYKLILSERSNPIRYSTRTQSFLRKAYKRCDGIVFQTEKVSAMYEDIDQSKKTVIPNAVGNPYAYKTKWTGVDSNKVVAIGRFIKEKDYTTLIEAFRLVHDKQPLSELEIIGDGPLKVDIGNLLYKRGMDSFVTLTGSKEDALVDASKGACYVLSSLLEGMPNTLLEAMAIGMPCVSTDCDFGPSELIEDGLNGLLVPVGDSHAMAKAILLMLEDKEFAKKCGNEAKKISESHDLIVIGQRYQSFIHSIAQK